MRYLCFTLVFICTMATISYGQTNHLLKIKPYEPFTATIGLHYESLINDNLTLQIGGGYTKRKVTVWDTFTGKLSGFYGAVELRYYFNSSDMQGIYAGSFLKYSQYEVTLADPNNQLTILAIDSPMAGITVGVQFTIREIIFVDLALGSGYAMGSFEGRITQSRGLINLNQTGIKPRLTFSIGMSLYF